MDPAASRSRARALALPALILLLGFIGIQFIRPDITNPPVRADLEAPPEVKQIFRNSCYNCHSNETRLPWYDKLAPAYWIVAHDIRQARLHLNFSDLGGMPATQRRAALFQAVNMVQLGAMPLGRYTLLHPNAIVAPDDLETLKHYLNPRFTPPQPNPPARAAADEQYKQWIESRAATFPVRPAPNGIAYIPDYRNWKVISTTNRFDNKTLRVIFGNDIAIKAIAEHRTNPWPDGTTFAKAAWQQSVDDNGDTKSGAFIQVEVMIKDAQKYAETEGWGWARWIGGSLRPFGANATFTDECTTCHAPMRHNDYVFTFPLEGHQ
jgi:mono/diheme cytochrome c family protein